MARRKNKASGSNVFQAKKNENQQFNFERNSKNVVNKNSNSKPPMTITQLIGSIFIAGYFVAMNVIEIGILKYGHIDSDYSILQFISGFYSWKASSNILSIISKVGLIIGPFILFGSFKEGILDTFILRKKATFLRNLIDFILFISLIAYVVIVFQSSKFESIVASTSTHFEDDEVRKLLYSSYNVLLKYQYIGLFINIISGILPWIKYQFSNESKRKTL